MSSEVRVPTTGNAGEDVVVAQWSVAEGDSVAAGQVLLVLETAKSTVDIESPVDGVLLKTLAAEGDEVAEFAAVAVVGEPGEAIPDAAAGSPVDGVEAAASPPAVGRVGTSSDGPTAESSGVLVADATVSDRRAARAARSQVKASPRAALLAQRSGIDIGDLTGSGPGGRIIVSDVLSAKAAPTIASAAQVPAAVEAPPAPRPSAAMPAPDAALAASGLADDAGGNEPEFDVVPVRGARKVTAQRMHESLQTSAQVTLTRYADATRLFGFAARLAQIAADSGRPRIGVNDLLLFATARAVAKHPEANAAFDWNGIRRYRNVNLGFAVDTGDALLVPVIPDAASLALDRLSAQAREAIDAAHAGALTGEAMAGGTFTVSNLGGLGIHWFTPVLNPPQACILGIGAAHQASPDGPRQLPLSLTFDHRALDGAAAARVLADIAQNIETVDVLSAFSA